MEIRREQISWDGPKVIRQTFYKDHNN